MVDIIDGGDYGQVEFVSVQADRVVYVEVDFTDCVFDKCSFYESVFKDCRFENCIFKNCEMSGIKVTDSIFVEASFEFCKIIGVDWTTKATSVFSKLKFSDSNISYCSFVGLKLMEMETLRCRANDIDFSDCNLSNANFDGTDLAMTRFGNTNLTGANFSGAFNYAIDPRFNKVKRAVFSMPEAASLLDGFGIVIR
ncbi:MAG: pentapeptide repeat-containing protein [Phycisphaerae bacterium]|nr:pentapeptide repeat-containing protein [Phycisphaerae bacterium]